MGHDPTEGMKMRQYERWILEWFQRNLTHNDPMRVGLKLSAEAGEVNDALLGEHGETTEDLICEIGDTLVCLTVLLNMHSATLEDAFMAVTRKLSEREADGPIPPMDDLLPTAMNHQRAVECIDEAVAEVLGHVPKNPGGFSFGTSVIARLAHLQPPLLLESYE